MAEAPEEKRERARKMMTEHHSNFGTITFKVSRSLMAHIEEMANEDLLRPNEWCLNCVREVVKEIKKPKEEDHATEPGRIRIPRGT